MGCYAFNGAGGADGAGSLSETERVGGSSRLPRLSACSGVSALQGNYPQRHKVRFHSAGQPGQGRELRSDWCTAVTLLFVGKAVRLRLLCPNKDLRS